MTGKPFVKEWVHGGFITVDGKKMSKSLGNIITLETLRAKGIDPLAFRYFVLSAHYSSPLNFTWGAVEGTESAYKKLKELRKYYKDLGVWDYVTAGFEWLLVNKNIKKYRNDFLTCINDDLNIPKAIALLWTLVKDNNIPKPFKKKLMLDFDKVLGLGLEKIEEVKIPEEVRKLIIWRDEARAEKDFVKSDELRKKIEELGFSVQDTDSGTKVTKNPKFLL